MLEKYESSLCFTHDMLVSRVDGERVLPEIIDVRSRELDFLDFGVEIYRVDEVQ